MIFLGLLALGTMVQAPSPTQIAEFAADYRARNQSDEDPAIERALALLTDFVTSNLRRNWKANNPEIGRWLTPFQSAIDPKLTKDLLFSDPRFIEVTVDRVHGYTFLVGQMGDLSRTLAFDPSHHAVPLPKEFNWNPQWLPHPQPLPNGYILLNEYSMPSEGNCIPIRFVWLKPNVGKLKIVGTFAGMTTLDYGDPIYRGTRMTLKTEDSPLVLEQMAAEFVLERDTTWECSPHGFRRIRSVPKQLALRSVDHAIFNAWHAKRRTPLQSRICHLYPPGQPVEMDEWSESRSRSGLTLVTLNRDERFFLKRVAGRYRLVRISVPSNFLRPQF